MRAAAQSLLVLIGALVVAPAAGLFPRAALAVRGGPVTFEIGAGPSRFALPVQIEVRQPEILVTSPAYGSTIAGSAVTVSGSVSDRAAPEPDDAPSPVYGELLWSVSSDETFELLGEGTATVVDGRFTIADLPLAAGANWISLLAVDAGGLSSVRGILVISDPDAPAVALVSPQDGEAVLAASAAVDLNFAEATTLVSVNGAPDGRVLGPGLVQGALTLPLALGANAFTLELEGPNGAFTFSFTLFRVESLEPPRITSIRDGGFTNQPMLAVAGTLPLGTPYVEVNGVPAVIAGASFTASIPLREGSNAITVAAYSPQASTTQIQVTLDTRPPGLRSLIPDDGSQTLDAEVLIGAVFDEAAQIEVTGPADSVSGHTRPQVLGSFPAALVIHLAELDPLLLEDGANDLTLSATDAAGNQTLVELRITKSGAALALSSPADGSAIDALRVAPVVEVLAGVTLDALYSGALRVPGFEGATLAPGLVPLPAIPLVPGANEIRIVYRRAGGPQEVVRFAYQSTATDAMTLTGQVRDAASGTAVGGALVSIQVNGLSVIAVTGADGRYSVAVEPGNATVVAMAEGYTTESTAGSGGAGDTVVADLALDNTGIPGLTNEIAILVPPQGTVTDFEKLTVVGTVLNPLSTVSVNGIAAEVIGHRFTARSVPLAMGANTISVTASALGAPAATTSVAVERATEPVLAVKIFSPPPNATIPGGGLVIRGFVSASDSRTTTNLGLVAVADGVFELADVVMPAGPGHITATSRTRDDMQQAVDAVPVSVLSTEPALVMVADPASGLAPLSSVLSTLVGAPTPLSFIAVRSDLDADGFADPVDGLLNNDVIFPEVGTFFPRTEIVTPEGVELGATGRVEVHLPSESLRTFAAGNPVDLAAAPDSDLWVLDASLPRIRRFTRDGALVSEFGSGGAGTSQLSAPQGLAAAPDGRLYVADTGNHRVQVFEADGTWVRSIGERGNGALQFESPRAVLVDGGRLFVSDAGNDRVQMVSLDPLRMESSFPLTEPRRLASQGIGSVLVASPATGVRSISGRRVGSIAALDRLPDQGVPESPVAIGVGSDAVYIADASRSSVIVLGADLEYRRVLEGLDRPPLSVLGGTRGEQESVYIADGTRVVELSVPTESPRATYDAFVARMAAGDIAGALAYVHPERRAHYERVFTIITGQLPQQAAILATAELAELRETRAVFHVQRSEMYQGQSVVNTYPIVMAREREGEWRIWVY